ncbi:MAG: cation diffusion facilitator family transporter [Mycoplasmatales bacterium]
MQKESHNYEHTHDHELLVNHDNVVFTLIVNTVFSLIELFGAIITNSSALMSNFIHDFGDSMILFFTIFIEKKAAKKRSKRYTYGYRRYTLVSSILNLSILFFGSLIIFAESIKRMIQPEVVDFKPMVIIAIIGITANFLGYLRLKKSNSLTDRQLQLNLLSDVIAWSLLLLSAIIIYFTQWYIVDSIFSFGFSLFMFYHVLKNVKPIFSMLMQAVPEDVSIEEVMAFISEQEHVIDVHDVHIWNLDGEDYIMSCHLVVCDSLAVDKFLDIKEQIKIKLETFGINHSTIEIENESHFQKLEEIIH